MTFREIVAYWLTDNGAPYSRIEYQVNKAGHALLIALGLLAIVRVFGWEPPAIPVTIAVVLVYWSADWWAPFADHKHKSDHPLVHFTAKLIVGMLAPVLLASFERPWLIVVWFLLYLPVLVFRL